jgi:hypothetical protein
MCSNLQIVKQGFGFVNWTLQNVVDPQLFFITDEAHFHLGAYVNSQNTWTWSDKYPHTFHQVPLHDKC